MFDKKEESCCTNLQKLENGKNGEAKELVLQRIS